MLAEFLSVLGVKPNETATHKQDAASESSNEITVHPFIDFYLDVKGWYAMGHHHPKEFITAVRRHESHYSLTTNRVEQTWAKITEESIEYLDQPAAGTQPITSIVLFDDPL